MAEHFITIDDARQDLLMAAAYLAERVRSSDGHASAVSAVVSRFLARSNVDLAAELANSVADPFTRDKLLSVVAEKCAEIDDDEYALQLADAVEELGLRAETLERVALQTVKKGQFDKAVEIAETMQHPDLVYAAVAAGLSSSGDRERAAELLARVEYPHAKVSSLSAMAIHEGQNGSKDRGVELLDQALETATEIEHNEERIRTICDVGNHFVALGRNDLAIGAYERAREFAEQLDNIHRDAFIGAAVMGFLYAGSLDTADRALDLIVDKTQVANCLLAFSKYLWDREDEADAVDALDEAYEILRSQREMETRDSKARFSLFGSIAAQYAGFGKAERAIEIASAIEDDGHRTAALAQLSFVFALRHEDEHARNALNEIPDDADRATALISMSDAKEQIGERDSAVELLDEAAHLIEEVPQLTSRAFAYDEIARRYDERGEIQRALDVFDACLKTAAEIRDESNRATTLAALSDFFADDRAELQPSQERLIESMLAKA